MDLTYFVVLALGAKVLRDHFPDKHSQQSNLINISHIGDRYYSIDHDWNNKSSRNVRRNGPLIYFVPKPYLFQWYREEHWYDMA